MRARHLKPFGAAGGAALVLIVAGALAAAACGTATAGHPAAGGRSQRAGVSASATPRPGGRAAQPVLCAQRSALTRVTVHRTAALHAIQPGQVLRREVVFTEPHVVRGLAAALCALPRAPHAPTNCPADFVGRLRLAFAAGARRFPPVVVQTSGCRIVVGLGPPRRPTPGFWHVLLQDVGVRPPGPGSGASP